jgi:hypothetical protein
MSEMQPHITPWAERLQQATLPEVGPAWTAMEALLDREMPVREKRDRRRWLLLILLLLLIIGICNCPGRGRLFGDRRWKGGVGQGVVRQTAKGSDSGTKGGPAQSGGAEKSGGPAKAGGLPNEVGSAETNQPGVTPDAPGAPRTRSPNSSRRKVVGSEKPGGGHPSTGGTTKVETRQRSVTPDGIRKQPALQKGAQNTPTESNGRQEKPIEREDPRTKPAESGGTRNRPIESDNVQRQPSGSASASKKPTMQDSASKKPALPDSAQKAPLIPDSARKNPVISDSVRKKPVTPDSTRKKPAAKDSTRKKPPAPPKDEEDKETEKGFVAAMGFNQFFPIGGQQVSDFNSGGITGTLGDYLPVPVGRYYFNKNLYVQLEVQFNAPQYTKKDLVIKPAKPDTLSQGRVQSSTVTIKKLLYFNVPLSVNYAPIDGLSLGAGLQFSRLRNAFGSFDTTITNTISTPVDSVVGKRESTLKGSTVYQNISTNEFRVLADVNYTYKHFILGMRYNRALSNFINVQVGSGNVTQSRNNSLQLYLRYILFDGRKKKSSVSSK